MEVQIVKESLPCILTEDEMAKLAAALAEVNALSVKVSMQDVAERALTHERNSALAANQALEAANVELRAELKHAATFCHAFSVTCDKSTYHEADYGFSKCVTMRCVTSRELLERGK